MARRKIGGGTPGEQTDGRSPTPRHHRTPFEVVGIMDNVIVRFVDLTPRGAGLLSPHAVTPGRVVRLRVGLPMADGRVRDTRLRLTVTSCAAADAAGDPPRVWRIGGTVIPHDEAERDALVESWHVVTARSQPAETARLLADVAAADPARCGRVSPFAARG